MKEMAVNADNQPGGVVAGNGGPIKIYVYVFVLASICIVVGTIWDYDWHVSIGRDYFFTPPHNLIYLGPLLAGTFSGYQVLKISFFGTAAEKAASVKFWGIFYSSIGGLICIWGALAMLTGAPFDNWWHSTFGLDVKLLSPPHTLLAAGMMAIELGSYVTVVAAGAGKKLDARTVKIFNWLFALSAGSLITMIATQFYDQIEAGLMHSIGFYMLSAAIFPVFLFAVSIASKSRWGATISTAVYMSQILILLWFIPLFHAQPHVAPIYNHSDYFQPYKFPLLLIIPAMAIDIIFYKLKDKSPLVKVPLASLVFLLIFFVVQYNFGTFYHTSVYSRNWFFGANSIAFFEANTRYRYAFHPAYSDTGVRLVKGLCVSAVAALASGFLGYYFGGWMKRIKR